LINKSQLLNQVGLTTQIISVTSGASNTPAFQKPTPISTITTLIMEIEAVSEAVGCMKHLMQLPAQEDLTEPTNDLEQLSKC